MSMRRKLLGVLGLLHRRMMRVENDADRNTATLDRLEQAFARVERSIDKRIAEALERLERAGVEQGKTLGQLLVAKVDEASRTGIELKRHEETLFNHEGRLGHLERAAPNGAE